MPIVDRNEQLRQGSIRDAQETILNHAIEDDSPYGPVRGLAKLDFDLGMARTGNFDKAMRHAGLGPTATDLSNRATRRSTQPGTPPAAPQFRHIVDSLMQNPMAKPRLGAGAPPTWGFHEPTVQAGAGVDAAMQATPQVLSDPRNAWFGLGPIGMAMRPVSGVGGWMRGWEKGRDLGGFKPPVGHIPDMPNLTNENELAQGLMSPDATRRSYLTNMLEGVKDLAPGGVNNIYEVEKGLRALKAERDLAMFGGGSAGGAIPPRSIMEDLQGKYGFGQQAQDALYEGYRQNSLPTTRPRSNTRKPKEEYRLGFGEDTYHGLPEIGGTREVNRSNIPPNIRRRNLTDIESDWLDRE